MITDVVDKFTDDALRIRDEVDVKNLDDAEYKKMIAKAFYLSMVSVIMNWGDGLLEIANRDDR